MQYKIKVERVNFPLSLSPGSQSQSQSVQLVGTYSGIVVLYGILGYIESKVYYLIQNWHMHENEKQKKRVARVRK